MRAVQRFDRRRHSGSAKESVFRPLPVSDVESRHLAYWRHVALVQTSTHRPVWTRSSFRRKSFEQNTTMISTPTCTLDLIPPGSPSIVRRLSEFMLIFFKICMMKIMSLVTLNGLKITAHVCLTWIRWGVVHCGPLACGPVPCWCPMYRRRARARAPVGHGSPRVEPTVDFYGAPTKSMTPPPPESSLQSRCMGFDTFIDDFDAFRLASRWTHHGKSNIYWPNNFKSTMVLVQTSLGKTRHYWLRKTVNDKCQRCITEMFGCQTSGNSGGRGSASTVARRAAWIEAFGWSTPWSPSTRCMGNIPTNYSNANPSAGRWRVTNCWNSLDDFAQSRRTWGRPETAITFDRHPWAISLRVFFEDGLFLLFNNSSKGLKLGLTAVDLSNRKIFIPPSRKSSKSTVDALNSQFGAKRFTKPRLDTSKTFRTRQTSSWPSQLTRGRTSSTFLPSEFHQNGMKIEIKSNCPLASKALRMFSKISVSKVTGPFVFSLGVGCKHYCYFDILRNSRGYAIIGWTRFRQLVYSRLVWQPWQVV